MAVNVEEVVTFFWNGFTDNSLIDRINTYVEIELRINMADGRHVSNGWRYQTDPNADPAEYLDQATITQIIQGFAAKMQAEMTSNPSNPFIMKLHKPGTQSRGDALREQEYFNLNDILPYTSISAVLRTVRTVSAYTTGPVGEQTSSSGVDAASSMDDTSVSDIGNISDMDNTPAADSE